MLSKVAIVVTHMETLPEEGDENYDEAKDDRDSMEADIRQTLQSLALNRFCCVSKKEQDQDASKKLPDFATEEDCNGMVRIFVCSRARV